MKIILKQLNTTMPGLKQMQMNIKSIPAIPFKFQLLSYHRLYPVTTSSSLIVKDNFTEFIVGFKHFRTQCCVCMLPLLSCRIRLGIYWCNILNKTFLCLQTVVAWNGQLHSYLNHLAIFLNHSVDHFGWFKSK